MRYQQSDEIPAVCECEKGPARGGVSIDWKRKRRGFLISSLSVSGSGGSAGKKAVRHNGSQGVFPRPPGRASSPSGWWSLPVQP
jgi:hypothetical protein